MAAMSTRAAQSTTGSAVFAGGIASSGRTPLSGCGCGWFVMLGPRTRAKDWGSAMRGGAMSRRSARCWPALIDRVVPVQLWTWAVWRRGVLDAAWRRAAGSCSCRRLALPSGQRRKRSSSTSRCTGSSRERNTIPPRADRWVLDALTAPAAQPTGSGGDQSAFGVSDRGVEACGYEFGAAKCPGL